MVSMETIERQRKDEEPMGGEGFVPALAPRRRGRALVILALVLGIPTALIAWAHERGVQRDAWNAARQADSAAPATRPAAVPLQRWGPLGSQSRSADGRAVRLNYVAGDVVGLTVDGQDYDLVSGDLVDGVAVGLFSARWADVSVDGSPRRLFIGRSSSISALQRFGSVTGGRGPSAIALPRVTPALAGGPASGQ
jgi:hypothetical protein